MLILVGIAFGYDLRIGIAMGDFFRMIGNWDFHVWRESRRFMAR